MTDNTSVAGRYVCEACERTTTRAVHPIDILRPPPCPECGGAYVLEVMWIRGRDERRVMQKQIS